MPEALVTAGGSGYATNLRRVLPGQQQNEKFDINPARRKKKTICHTPSCILHKLFKSADVPSDLKTRFARSATMHEIPNLPFPSLQETQQPIPQHTSAEKPALDEAQESLKANSED